MILRDYNHPSVIAWSLTNEPQISDKPECVDYYEKIVQLAHALDSTRPVVIVMGTNQGIDKPVQIANFFDLIGYVLLVSLLTSSSLSD